MYKLRLCVVCVLSFFSLHAEEAPALQEGYTINYDTVSMVEYLRFASKICGINFIFEETDLPFTVSVISDAPISADNVMATLIQVLRIHGLSLLEQEGNLVINKGTNVSQIATLVTQGQEGSSAPIVTRIFRVKNTKVDSVAGIIRPMISSSALLEVSVDTRQLILTDLTANVDKVAGLIEILDSPHAPLEIKTFEAVHNTPQYLVDLCSQIMDPIAQGNPFILVPQALANQIFIVSTPGLTDQALAVFKSLDTEPKQQVASQRKLKPENVFVYRAEHKTNTDLLKGLLTIAHNLQKSGIAEGDLIETIELAKLIKETNSILFLGSKDAIAKVQEFLLSLDSTGTGIHGDSFFFVYKPNTKSAKEIETALQEMATHLKSSKGNEQLVESIGHAKINTSTNTLIFSGDDKTLAQIKELLSTVDEPSSNKKAPSGKNQFFLYKIQKAPFEALESSLKSFAKNLDKSNVMDEGLIHSIETMKYIKETHSVLFTGSDAALRKLQEIVPSFDSGSIGPALSTQFFIYKPHYSKGDALVQSLKELADTFKNDTLKDPAFIKTLDSVKFVKSTNSLIFTGDEVSIQKLEKLIATLDLPGSKGEENKNFFLFPPQNASKEKTENYLKMVADNLNKKNDEELIEAIRSMKWIEPSYSFMFHGSDQTLLRIKELLTDFDQPSRNAKRGFFLYSAQYAPEDKIDQYLSQVADNLAKKATNPELVDAIKSRKWIEESRSFMFNGMEPSLEQIKSLLDNYDKEDSQEKPKSSYFIYKVQHTTGDLIEDDLDQLAKNFKASGVKNPGVLNVLNNLRYIKETNSLLLTGDAASVEEVKKWITDYDYPRAADQKTASNFLMYKPQHLKAANVEKSLKEIALNLKKAQLADPNLLQAIDAAKYVETTNSLVFTGNPDTLQKIQTLVKDIDVPPTSHTPIQTIGKTTFLLYKLKNASGTQIVNSLKSITDNLKKSDSSDPSFLSALNSIKYVKETNSLLFTGTEEALEKVQKFVQEFDITGLAGDARPSMPPSTNPGQPNFWIYRPTALSGPDLEHTMLHFAENLKASGLADPDLFYAISSMRWVEKTHSLIFTGTPKSLDQVKDLVTAFDIPANLTPEQANALESSLQTIDNTSFLVYKLQFHKGDEIQGALRQIAKDLTLSKAPVNQNLLNSINSIQWLEITNSLLCSGDQETLTRLRELIKNLDIPLKQVFIEMLVIETSLSNTLNFGLEWGANYKYKNSFAGSLFNQPQITSTNSQSSFINYLSQLNPPTAPTPVNTGSNVGIGPSSGFDLGVIGEVIRHNGQTFLTIGSLLTALQKDTETAVIMTPKIITQDGRTSSIFVGTNQPFAGSFVSNTQSGSTIQTSNLEYRDIGLNLTITPVLGNSDVVTLDINLDRSIVVSDATGATIINTGSGSTATGITTSKTNMQTTVHVPDKNFLILSGFVNNSSVKTKTGFPCLGGLPVIGAAFSKSDDTLANQNIVIFLRPHIITSVEDMRKMTSDQEDAFRDQTFTPFLERNYDEALEMIKTVDDE